MDEGVKILVGAAATAAGLLGLFMASRGDAGIQIFGLLLAGFAVFMNFWLIKRHFDQIDGASRQI